MMMDNSFFPGKAQPHVNKVYTLVLYKTLQNMYTCTVHNYTDPTSEQRTDIQTCENINRLCI